MEPWEVAARESIRDLVARYNANGDTGRFAQVLELFAPDAVMEVGDVVFTGRQEIERIFTSTRDRNVGYVRHMTATHQIDVHDERYSTGRCYFFVLTSVGLDHWGRYVDEYRTVGGRWVFGRRRVTTDGYTAASLFAPRPEG